MGRLPVSLAVILYAVGGTAWAAPVWVGDMETGDLSQWGYLLNPEINGMTYAGADTEFVIQGEYAARLELHDDAVWGNGLRRVEMQHAPADGRTAEGATTYFAWSFYLPEVLSTDPSQQIGYWESNDSYQQMMAFEVSGERISFSTRRPNNVVQWDQPGVATAGAWHRIAMRILWSTSVDVGEVDVWFDGALVVDAAAAQTLADGNSHFTQLGLLRGDFDFSDVPVIIIDDAVEGDSLEDVHPELDPPGGTSGGGDTGDTGVGDSGGVDSSGGGDGPATTVGTTDPDPTTVSGSGGMTGGGSDGSGGGSGGGGGGGDGDGGGCGCTHRGAGSWGVLAVLAWVRRRRSR